MKQVLSILLLSCLFLGILSYTTQEKGDKANLSISYTPDIPRTWDSTAMATVELPLATSKASPKHVSSDYYYKLPERVIYKSYPVYAPGREPKGYWEWLKKQEPQVVFDPAKLKTEADWIKAGEVLFDTPIDTDGAILSNEDVRDPAFYAYTKMPVTQEGIMPYARYVITEKGKVLTGNLACSMCHTRVEPNGTVLKGAQGNFPGDLATAWLIRNPNFPEASAQFLTGVLFDAPFVKDDPNSQLSHSSKAAIVKAFEAVPPGAFGRQGTSILFPPSVPDLIGVQERTYLDHGGLSRHRNIGDMMRYIALNQALDFLGDYDGYIPVGAQHKTRPEAGKSQFTGTFDRHSEAQLYAISKYVYSLKPPVNPNKPSALSKRGETIFIEQGCVSCHTPPLYTNNMLTPADGFTVPDDHLKKYDIFDISIGTDPGYTMKTRRGTGYYKVPSLKGVWYRGPFLHDGSLATLPDMLDPNRLQDKYVPTGFKGADVKTRAVRGHEFGLELSATDRNALLAFLKTL
ncbi:c-type cytochrome [Spirosoma litoris]